MKVFFAFNHPAPYKVRTFNELNKYFDIFVIFERTKAKNRPLSFYNCNQYDFPHMFLKRGSFGDEQSNTGELKKYLKHHHQEYDLIVMNGYSTISEMRAIRYLIKKKIPYVLQINGGIPHKNNAIKRRLKNYFISHAYKYLSPGDIADEYLLTYGAKKEDILHYPYTTLEQKDNLTNLIKDKEPIRKKYNLPSSPLFIAASQFIERKNNVYLIHLFKNVNANLLLIGDGKEKDLYKEIIEKEKINNVFVRDFVPKETLYEILQGADYFITLSKEDIYGHSTLEALANGLPVISSDRVISSRQIIKNNENGFLVSIEKEEEILSAINNIGKIDLNKCLASAKEYTIENSAKTIADKLKGLIKQ